MLTKNKEYPINITTYLPCNISTSDFELPDKSVFWVANTTSASLTIDAILYEPTQTQTTIHIHPKERAPYAISKLLTNNAIVDGTLYYFK